MNLFKRAWWRLRAHLGRTALLTGLFSVICTLVLSGFLIQSSAARAAADAKKSVGVVATMQLDLNALINSGRMASMPSGQSGGTIGAAGNLYSGPVDKVGKTSEVVLSYNYTTDAGAAPTSSAQLYQPIPAPVGTDTTGTDFFKADGVRDSSIMPDFRNGTSKIVSGVGITPRTTGYAVLVEQRMAARNHLKVGDRVSLAVGEMGASKAGIGFTVVGIYQDSTADSNQYTPAMMNPANHLYVSPQGGSALLGNAPGPHGSVIKQATFTLSAPGDLAQLKKDARAAGLDPVIFPLSLNDKQYQTLLGPINRTAGFATLTVWLVAVAGAVIIGLIVTLSLRERRREMGILLALGERKPRLLGQHLVEVLVCALIAVALSAGVSQFLSQSMGSRLLAGEVSAAKNGAQDPSVDLSSTQSGTGSGTGSTSGSGAGAGSAPVDHISIRLGAGDIAKVGAAGLGIAVLATLIPGFTLLRLKPRTILSKGD
ncbi:ABC transporter permease [Streptacidiphilus sp. N1-3]|uniref:ABC transporter permease n=1 Tax=Streptacidiphilus alkalitolerans TaxID=3342712 RepID=A0ABV6X1J4_9ACTN